MSKTYLLLGYYNSFGANSTCARNIANELAKRGNRVLILTYDDLATDSIANDNELIKVFRRKRSLIERAVYNKGVRGKIASILRLAWAVPLFPNVSPIQTWRMTHCADILVNKYHVDTVLGFYRPYEMIGALLNLKRKYKSRIMVVSYHLDLMTVSNNKVKVVDKYKRKKAIKAFRLELKLCDKILLPKSAEQAELGNTTQIRYVDFPVFVPMDSVPVEKNVLPLDTINIVYAGSLDKDNRNPAECIALIKSLPQIKGRSVMLHIWGGVQDKETLSIINNNSSVIYHGITSSEKVPGILKEADFLLNVSNKVTYKMLPSKIFQMFAANKPIINYVQNEKDVSIPYFDRTKCVFTIQATLKRYNGNILENFENGSCLTKLESFIRDHIDAIVDNKELFLESTPQYVTDLIEVKDV